MKELWKPVVGWEGWYEVSDQGRCRRVASGKGTRAGKLLRTRLSPNSKSYPRVGLHDKLHGRAEDKPIHHLVMESFVGPRPPGKQINHKNGVKADNRLINLEYVTPRENVIHSRDVLGNGIGERGSQARLKETQVLAMRHEKNVPCECCGRTPTYEMLAEKYDVTVQTVASIIQRKSWVHLEAPPGETNLDNRSRRIRS